MKTSLHITGLMCVLTAAAIAQPRFAAAEQEEFNIALPAPPQGGGNVAFTAAPAFTYIASEMSFDGAQVKNAPYSAEAVTETTQRLADGNRISQKNTARLYRDAEGRTRREETLGAIGPWASNSEPVRTIFINDPVTKTHMVLNPQDKTVRKMQIGEAMPMSGAFVFGTRTHEPPPPDGGPQMTVRGDVVRHVQVLNGAGPAGATGVATAGRMVAAPFPGVAPGGENVKEESLGTRMIEGVRADGTRTVITIPAGSIGNDQPIAIESERWYSPELQTVVMTRRNDPRMGETVYKLTAVSRTEPSQSLFEAPADYTVLTEDNVGPHKIEMKMIERRKQQ